VRTDQARLRLGHIVEYMHIKQYTGRYPLEMNRGKVNIEIDYAEGSDSDSPTTYCSPVSASLE
jgi:hypothetical protein